MVNGDISSTMISGVEAFSQAVQFFVLTERRKYPIYSDDYGIEEANSIFTEKNVEEFQRQAQNIALHLIDYFAEWIEEIYRTPFTLEGGSNGEADCFIGTALIRNNEVCVQRIKSALPTLNRSIKALEVDCDVYSSLHAPVVSFQLG